MPCSHQNRKLSSESSPYIRHFSSELSFLAAPTFCELLLGSMISGEGFLTQALTAIHHENVWSSYHHWVFLAIAFQRPSDKVHTTIPVMAFPAPKSGNISRIRIAKAMLKSVRQTLQGRILRLLTDSWFMNGPMMQPALELGYEVIGHIPKNRALYALPVEAYPPSPLKRKGRKRKYGAKMIPEEVEKLSETTMTIWLHRKHRTVSFRSRICRARFLKGGIVCVVWSRFENDKGQTEIIYQS